MKAASKLLYSASSQARREDSSERLLDRPESGRRLVLALTAALFALSLGVFIFSPIVDTSDSMYSIVLSESILHHHSTHLNWFQPPEPVAKLSNSTPPLTSATSTYQLGWVRGSLVYCYPNGSSILSLPAVALANWAGISATDEHGHYSKGGEFVIQKFFAAFLMAVLV